MHLFLAIASNDDTRENFASVLATLEADPGVVLRASLDGSKSGRSEKDGSIEFYADWETGKRLAEKTQGWQLFPSRKVKDAPDNNEEIDTLGPNPAFTDHRVRQPEATEATAQYVLTGKKASADFNAAAVILMKDPTTTLLGWNDSSNDRKSDLSGQFVVAAKDAETIIALAQKLPQWKVTQRRPG